jgi:DNA mismatch repair ATPase MutS
MSPFLLRFFAKFSILFSGQKRLQYLRTIWGRPIDKYRNPELIAAYHHLAAEQEKQSYVDKKTWSDLDLDSVFAAMDRNLTGIGQQYLYHLMHTYEQDENQLKRRSALTSSLKDNQELRESIQLALSGLSGMSSYFIAYLVLSTKLPHTRYYLLFYLCPLFWVISFALMWVNPAFLIAALAITGLNIVLDKVFAHRIYEYFAGFSGLNALITSGLSLSTIPSVHPIGEIELLKQERRLLASLKKKLGYFVIDKSSLPEMVALGIEYANMFLLFDIIAYYRSVATLLKHQNDMHSVFKNIASLDAATAVASYLEEHPVHTAPVFRDGGIAFRNLYHPLIPDAVSNTLEHLDRSMLITGSNMSGKTSFIKTMGINVILARSLYFSLATNFSIPKFIVKSSIKRNEDLEEGKSYFFVEIEELHTFMRLSEREEQYLFLIDEIFRGTNTIERLASSTAVLKYLDMKNTVCVTTHDIELQELLEHHYRMFHFSEQVDGDRFFFDYTIRKGPCTSGNAIKLLEIMNYPATAVAEARSIVKNLLHNNSSIPDGQREHLI